VIRRPQSRKFSQSDRESSVVARANRSGRALFSHRSRGAAWIGSGHIPVAASTASPRSVAIRCDSPIDRASRFGTANSTSPAASSTTEAKRIAVTATPATASAGAFARASAARDALAHERPELVGREVPAESLGGLRGDRKRRLRASARLRVEQHAAHAAASEIDSQQKAGAHRELSLSSKRSNSTFTAPCSPCA
jgi:hypothetical protein